MRRTLLCIVFILGGARGSAEASDTVACGSVSATNNIPNGAIFLSTGAGQVRSTLLGVGEIRSHSGISHGNGWFTHSTMFEPRLRDWDDSECSCGLAGDYCCQGPLKGYELQNGYPGSSQITGGALYNWYYDSHNGVAPDFVYYQRSLDANGGVDTRGATVANWLWSNANYAWVSSRQNGGYGFYRVGFTGVTPYAQYSLYQYRDYQNINNGGVPWNYGDVCSTILSYAQQQSGQGAINNVRNARMARDAAGATIANSYDHTYVVNGLNNLYNAVYQDCSDANGFIENVGAFFTCLGESDICDDAARQASNCFADGINGSCYNDSDKWVAIKNNVNPGGPVDGSGYSIAKSISPDNIGGWSGWGSDRYVVDSIERPSGAGLPHAVNVAGVKLDGYKATNRCVSDICSIDPYCCNSSWDGICVNEVNTVCNATDAGTHSVWSGDTNQGVSWSTGGNSYNCWF
jgi:hypothetical protein